MAGMGSSLGFASPATLVASGSAQPDFGPVLKTVEVVRGDDLAWLNPLHRGGVAIGYAHGNVLHFDGLILRHHINKRRRTVALHGGGGNERLVMQRFDEQLRIDELVGEENVVFVGKNRPHPDGAGL